jgi:hypothetical protein
VVALLILIELQTANMEDQGHRIYLLITLGIEVVYKKGHGHMEAQSVSMYVQTANMEAQDHRIFLPANMDLETVLKEDHAAPQLTRTYIQTANLEAQGCH